MDEEQKKQVAVFRFGVIADFVTGARLSRADRCRLLAQKCARKWNIPFSHRTRIGRSSRCSGLPSKWPGSAQPQAVQQPRESSPQRPSLCQSRSINSSPQLWHQVLPPAGSCTLPV